MGSKMSKVTRNTFFQHFWAVYLVTKGNVTDFFFDLLTSRDVIFQESKKKEGVKNAKNHKNEKTVIQ